MNTIALESEAWLDTPLSLVLHLNFAFDIGDEIDLERALRCSRASSASCPGGGGRRSRSATALPPSAFRSTRPDWNCPKAIVLCRARGPS